MMMLAFAVGLMAFSVAVISIPLFFQPLESYEMPAPAGAEFSERDALLEALSELEREFGSGKLSQEDFARERASLQRAYLAAAEGGQAAPGAPKPA